jgi:4-hydroxy-tetrahydrodipicolinate synthase
MSGVTLMCRNATTFNHDGNLDEDAFAASLQRFVDTGLGVYLASGGTGEGFALTSAEFRRVYQVARTVCGGKVTVGANPPEQHTPAATLELAAAAADAGVDIINVFGPAGWHGYTPHGDEYLRFFEAVLTELSYPVALCPNESLGYRPNEQLIAQLCGKFHQVTAVNLSGVSDPAYFGKLKALLERDVSIYVPYAHGAEQLAQGAAGLLGVEANVIPATCREFIDAYEAGREEEMHAAHAAMQRFSRFTRQFPGANVRWVKLAWDAFGLPGGGSLRLPYIRASEAEVEAFRRDALALQIPEIDALARAL